VFETKRIRTGIFQVYVNGVSQDMEIFNSSLGVSGTGNNLYGIDWRGKIITVGSLAKAKKTAKLWLGIK
jgi:hypothetical protein